MTKKMHEIAIFAIFLLHFSLARGDIRIVNITSDESDMILLSQFGFTTKGRLTMSIDVPSITITTPDDKTPANSSLFGFFITGSIGRFGTDCILDDPGNTMVFTFAELPPASTQSSFSKTINVIKHDYTDIFFGSCNPKFKVSFLVHIEAYNLDAKGRKEYLSDGETQLPTLFAYFAGFYALFLIIWLGTCLLKRMFVKKIHVLMIVLLLAKALNLVLAAEDKYHVNLTGTPHGWDMLYWLSHVIKGILLLVVIVLIGTGWSFLKPFLEAREKQILMIGIPLQVFVNISHYLYVEAMDSILWLGVFAVADVLCAGLIMFPIYWSMESIAEISKVDGKAAANLKKMRLFRNFYFTAFAYLVFKNYAMVEITDELNTFAHEIRWQADLLTEIGSLQVFYSVIFYLFRPVETNQYLSLPSRSG